MGQLENAELGENITAPAMVYISSSDGKMYKAVATDTAKGAQGSLLVSGSTGDNRQVHFGSEAIAWPSPLTAGATYYLSDTAGAITSTAPTNVQVVGFATAYGLFQQSIAPFASSGSGGVNLSEVKKTAFLGV